VVGRIHAGQSALRITVKTFLDLAGILAASIKYLKPDGTAGVFAAGVVDTAAGIIAHELIESELDQAGWWIFWASITFSDGRTAAGEAVRVFVWEEGSAP
jgi:hypothetical protein